MNHTRAIILALLLPPFLACAITREERIFEVETRIEELQEQKVNAQVTIMMAPWTLCCLSQEDREILRKAFIEFDFELKTLYREYFQLLASKE